MWVTDPRAPNGFFRTSDDQWIQQWTPQPGFVLGASAGDHLAVSADVKPVRDDPDRVGMDPEDLLALVEFHRPMAEAFRRFPAAEWEEVAARANVSVQRIRPPEDAFCDPVFLDDGCVVEIDDPEVGRIRQVGLTYHLHAAPGSVSRPAPIPDQHGEEIRRQFAEDAPTASNRTPSDDDAPKLPRGPLDGVVVLDLGTAIAGPFGTQMLADLGAEVIKVNTPTDRAWTEYYMGMCCNRGKRSIMIDLKKHGGLEVLTELVRRADVVHTNMHWDSVEKLGVDYESLHRVNPQLIYCHTRGFENGPRMLLVGHDQSGAALAGVTWEEGGMSNGGKPIWPNTSVGDTGNGLLSATAVIQALYHRDRTGEGQFVDTSIVYAHLLNASMAWLGLDGAVCARPRLDAEQYGLSALYRLYETVQGWLCLAVVSEKQWVPLCQALGLDWLAHDPRFATRDDRVCHDTDLAGLLSSVFAERTAEEWVDRLSAHGVPAEVSSETFALELFDDPEMIDRGLVVTHEHPLMGTVEMFGRTIDFSATPASITRGPIVAGQHSREILTEHGYDEAAIGRLLAEGVVFEAEDLR